MKRIAAALIVLAACGDDGGGADAAVDSGPTCACAYGAVKTAGAITAAGADELSGLAASHALADVVWTHNDSGDSARLFAVNPTGAARAIATLPNATATDWEDIAVGPCGSAECIYVADTGDNDLDRTSVRIYEVDEPTAIQGTFNATYRAFDIVYPDGAHNSEALFVDPRDGESYVITKQSSNPSLVFRMPRTVGVMTMALQIGTITVANGDKLVTAADLHADECGVKLAVRTYDALYEYSAAPGATIAQVLAAPPQHIPVADEMKGEAVTYGKDGRSYLTVSEGAGPVLSSTACM